MLKTDKEYNWVFKDLVTDSSDIIGAISYTLYKQQKIAFIESFKEENKHYPTDQELDGFHRTSSSIQAKKGYETQASNILNEAFNQLISEHILEELEKAKQAQIDNEVIQKIDDSTGIKQVIISGVVGGIAFTLVMAIMSVLIWFADPVGIIQFLKDYQG